MTVNLANDDTRSCVLVVDDDGAIRNAVRRVLVKAEFVVTTVGSASEALELLKNQRFDAIVTDIMMPGMDGLEFLRRLRQRDRELPVIILTGHPTFESAVIAVKEGGFRYVMKPFEAEELSSTVREAAAMFRLTTLKRRALNDRNSGIWQISEIAKLKTQFDSALAGISMVFQPIIDWPNRRLFGYEALVRTTAHAMGSPELLFDAAERLVRVDELGRHIRRAVAEVFHAAPPDAALFVNLHSADLNDEELFSASSPLSEYAHRVVLEITERASLEQVKDVQGGLKKLRRLGYRIAVDDLGAGYSGLSSFSVLEPDIVKLDISLIKEIDMSSRKASIVRSMLTVCARELGTKVVCEGIETEAERDTLEGLGATLFQGYLFARPHRGFRIPVLAPIDAETSGADAQLVST